MRMNIDYRKLTDTATTPTYGTDYAAGADLYADIEAPIYIDEGESVKISTGIAVAIPEGYVGLIFARSGLSCKNGLAPANKVGVIDSDYRGELIVVVHNHEKYNNHTQNNTDDIDKYYEDYIQRHTIKPGDRVAQLVIVPYVTAVFNEKDSLDDSARGSGGFGSTGK